jgi:tetratricopeptide (TPR) repeat protein
LVPDVLPPPRRFPLPWIAFALLAPLSAGFGIAPDLSLRRLAELAGLFSFAFLFVRIVSDAGERASRRAATILFASGALLGLGGLVLFEPGFAGVAIFSRADHRISFTFANANHFAAFLGPIALLGCGLAAAARGIDRWAFLGGTLLVGAALAATGSRAAAASLVVAALLLLALLWREARRRGEGPGSWLPVPIVLVAAAGLALLLRGEPILRRLRGAAGLLEEGRVEIWKSTVAMIVARPLLGFGPGTFEEGFPPFQSPPLARSVVNHAHSDWLELAAELGLPVLLLALWGAFSLARLGLRSIRAASPHGAPLRAAALASCAFAALHCLADFDLAIPAVALLFVACGALAVGLPTGGRVEARVAAPTARRPAGRLLLAALLLGIASLQILPLFAERRMREARRLRAERRLADAERAAQIAERLFPLSPEAPAERAAIDELAALTAPLPAERRARFESALAESGKALARRPSSARLLAARARLLAEAGRGNEAEKAWRASILLAPVRAVGHYELAELLLSRGRTDEALDSFRRAATLDPALFDLALDRLPDRGVGVEDLRRIAPESASARATLSARLHLRGENRAAAEEAAKAYRLEPTEKRAANEIRTWLRADLAEEGLPSADRALLRFPDSFDVLRAVIELYRDLAREDACVPLYRKLLEKRPDDPSLLLNFAGLLRRLHRCDEALALLAKGPSVAPADPRFPVLEAACRQDLGDPEGRLRAFERAVSVSPRDPSLHENLGAALLGAGRFAAAAEELRTCLTLDPKRESARRLLVEVDRRASGGLRRPSSAPPRSR